MSNSFLEKFSDNPQLYELVNRVISKYYKNQQYLIWSTTINEVAQMRESKLVELQEKIDICSDQTLAQIYNYDYKECSKSLSRLMEQLQHISPIIISEDESGFRYLGKSNKFIKAAPLLDLLSMLYEHEVQKGFISQLPDHEVKEDIVGLILRYHSLTLSSNRPLNEELFIELESIIDYLNCNYNIAITRMEYSTTIGRYQPVLGHWNVESDINDIKSQAEKVARAKIIMRGGKKVNPFPPSLMVGFGSKDEIEREKS
jgi:hypothetical protein